MVIKDKDAVKESLKLSTEPKGNLPCVGYAEILEQETAYQLDKRLRFPPPPHRPDKSHLPRQGPYI